MKKQIFSLLILAISTLGFGQEIEKGTIKSEKLDEVIVNAVRVKEDTPVTHSNLTKKDISKRNLGQDIPVLMNYLPSVITSSDAGAGVGYTYMRVRGSDASRINVTINGIPYNDAESQGTFWVNMSDFASSTESLQLQRGVGTSTNGSGAFGASLNILTDKISEKSNAEISNSFGSYGTRKHTVKYSTGKINNHVEFAGRLSNIHSDGYIDRAFSDLKSYFLQGSYSDDNTIIKALVFGGKEKTYQAWYGIDAKQLKENRRQNPYTYDNETDNYQQDHYQLHWTQKYNKYWSTNVGLNYTKGKGYYEQFKDKEEAKNFKNLITDGSDVIVRRWLDNDFYVMNFTANYKKGGLEVIGGTSFTNYTGDHFGEVIWGSDLASNTKIRDRYYFNDAVKTENSAFIKTSFHILPKLMGYVDLQGRFINYKTKGVNSNQSNLDVNKDFNFFNPKAGLTYKFDNFNSAYLSYARANREPNRDDFKNGTDQHETLNDFELGYRYNSENIKINANAYYMGYENQLVLTGEINDVGSPIRKNSGKSYRAGIEIDAFFNINNKLIIQPNFSYNHHKNVDFRTEIDGKIENLGNTAISFSPNVIAGNIITYIPTENLQISFLSKYVGEQHMSNLENRINGEAWGIPYSDLLEDYFTSDLNVTYEIKPKKIFKYIVLSGLVNNIFNKEYVDRGYFGTYVSKGKTVGYSGYYPQATRNFLIGLTLKF
ncbi:MAG: TonB-dependent receptor [Tenacibaculum sp.]|nr:TonB-dependent receptor [Tenacibaculum sp.]